MNFKRLIYLFFVLSGIVFLNSCADDEDKVNSVVKLLPTKIVTEYEGSNKRIFTYKYDDFNRLTEYKEISIFGNTMSFEDIETTCRIVYGGSNQIDSLIIIPRLLDPNKSRVITNEMYSFVNDTILFNYDTESLIKVKYKNKREEQILINSKNEVNAYNYHASEPDPLSVTNTFYYDNRGNIVKTIKNSTIVSSSNTNQYIYDNRNGVFKNINTPQWFLVIMLNSDFNLLNNHKEYSDTDGGKWLMEYDYNKEDYPEYSIAIYNGTSKKIASKAPTFYEYKVANQ